MTKLTQQRLTPVQVADLITLNMQVIDDLDDVNQIFKFFRTDMNNTFSIQVMGAVMVALQAQSSSDLGVILEEMYKVDPDQIWVDFTPLLAHWSFTGSKLSVSTVLNLRDLQLAADQSLYAKGNKIKGTRRVF